MNQFQSIMQPFPGLERWSRRLKLPGSGAAIHYYDTEEGERAPASAAPVVQLHGLGDEADTWRHVLPKIAARRAVAPDLPGFGRSDQGKHPYTIPFFADTLLELIDHLGLREVVLVGHSTGAIIAQEFALRNPQRVQRLVLIGGSLVAGESKPDPSLLMFLIPGLGEWAYNRLRKNPDAAYRSLEPYYHRLQELPQADRDFLYQRVNERVWSDGQRRGFLSTLRGMVRWLPAQQKSLPERLRNLQTPTTVIWGENDRIMPVQAANTLNSLLPDARLVVVPGAGHNVHQEKPEVVVEAIE